MTDITIIDDLGTPSDTADDVTLTAAECPGFEGPLAPLASVTCEFEIEVTDPSHVNGAATTGGPTDNNGDPILTGGGEPVLDEDGNPVLDEDGNPVLTEGAPLFDNPTAGDDAETLFPGIDLVKVAGDAPDGEVLISSDEEVTFTFTVTNTGGTHLSDIQIVDDAGTPSDTTDDVTLTSAECAELAGPLAPGESIECTLTLSVTESPYVNNATTIGTPTDENGDPYTSGDVPLLDEDGNPVLDADGNPVLVPGEPYDLADVTDEDPAEVEIPETLALTDESSDSAEESETPPLAFTGATTLLLVSTALSILAAGTLMVLAARRRRETVA